jgi:hypothetical protein
MFQVKALATVLNDELILGKCDGAAKKDKGKKEVLFHVDNVFTSVSELLRVSFTNMLIIFQKQNHSAVLKCATL